MLSHESEAELVVNALLHTRCSACRSAAAQSCVMCLEALAPAVDLYLDSLDEPQRTRLKDTGPVREWYAHRKQERKQTSQWLSLTQLATTLIWFSLMALCGLGLPDVLALVALFLFVAMLALSGILTELEQRECKLQAPEKECQSPV